MEEQYRVDFRKQQAVEALSEEIVGLAEATMTPDLATSRDARQLNNQLSNLLNVAQTTSSPRVVTNWIRYQMNRGETRRQWGNTGLGNRALADIATLDKSAHRIAKEVAPDEPDRHLADVTMRLIAQYAGYLRRSYVANGGRG